MMDINVERSFAMKDKMSLGSVISDRRKQMLLTQKELAEQIGVSKSAIAKWETDGGLPDRDNLKSLSEAMGISITDLYKAIDDDGASEVNLDANITLDVISVFESHGYKIIKPNKLDVKEKKHHE